MHYGVNHCQFWSAIKPKDWWVKTNNIVRYSMLWQHELSVFSHDTCQDTIKALPFLHSNVSWEECIFQCKYLGASLLVNIQSFRQRLYIITKSWLSISKPFFKICNLRNLLLCKHACGSLSATYIADSGRDLRCIHRGCWFMKGDA